VPSSQLCQRLWGILNYEVNHFFKRRIVDVSFIKFL